METILGDVLTWSWFSEPHGYNFNSLLIPDLDGNICIDPVEPTRSSDERTRWKRVWTVFFSPIEIMCGPQIGFASTPAPGATYIPKTPHTRKGRAPCSTAKLRTAKQSGRSR